MTETQIEVWLDTVDDPDDPLWCVSLCEDDGDEVSCIAAYEYRDDAIERAWREAGKRSLPAYERTCDGALHRLT